MKLRDTLCIGMSLAPTWLRDEGWRRPDSGIEGLFSAEFALDIARRAEAAHLDFVFRPDTHSLPVPVMETSFGFASLDSVLMMAALVQGTSRIGLVPTISTTFGHPYPTARQLMSLHWMSQGRAGCNIVTALQGQQNFGLTEMPSSAERYARAGEFVAAMQALWQSFPAEALRIDRATGQFADTALIRPADHHGAAFDIEGPLNIPAFPGPHIPMMQAGASAGGVALAGQMAEMVFAQTLTLQDALAARQALSRAAEAAGRAPGTCACCRGSASTWPTAAPRRAIFSRPIMPGSTAPPGWPGCARRRALTWPPGPGIDPCAPPICPPYRRPRASPPTGPCCARLSRRRI